MRELNVIETWLREFDKADDLAKDWLIKSWSLKNEDKEIALQYYKKADKQRAKLINRLEFILK